MLRRPDVPWVVNMEALQRVSPAQVPTDMVIAPSLGLEGHAGGVALAASLLPNLFRGRLAVFATL